MNVIYVGSIYPTGKIDELKAMGSSIDFAAETFQTSLLQGLCEFYPNLKVITAPNISAYPRVKNLSFKKEEFSLSFSGVKHLFTGFCNLPGVKHISKCLRVRRAIKQSLVKGRENVVIIYGVHSPFLLSLCGINRERYKSCLIVPDLPKFMSEKKDFMRKMAKKIDGRLINYAMRFIDSFVLFSPHMKEYLPIKKKAWIHMEGIFNTQNQINEHIEKTREKVILYTGNLTERMGIRNLLSAFSLISNNEYRLWVRGGGVCLNDVISAAKKDNRIQYIEHLSKEDLLRLQKKATVLINPVYSSQTFTRYFFPSKTMEYMASGTPTIMSKLDCLPEEYYPYLIFFDEESIEGLKNKIMEVCEKSQEELNLFGKAASKFIINEKNEMKQAKKIVDLIDLI